MGLVAAETLDRGRIRFTDRPIKRLEDLGDTRCPRPVLQGLGYEFCRPIAHYWILGEGWVRKNRYFIVRPERSE